MLLIGQRIDVEQLADGLAGSADILGQLRLERELLAAGQQVDKAADAGGQERQLIGDVAESSFRRSSTRLSANVPAASSRQ